MTGDRDGERDRIVRIRCTISFCILSFLNISYHIVLSHGCHVHVNKSKQWLFMHRPGYIVQISRIVWIVVFLLVPLLLLLVRPHNPIPCELSMLGTLLAVGEVKVEIVPVGSEAVILGGGAGGPADWIATIFWNAVLIAVICVIRLSKACVCWDIDVAKSSFKCRSFFGSGCNHIFLCLQLCSNRE